MLLTSIFPAFVHPDVDPEVDPAGRGGRKRNINVKTIGHGSGNVYEDAEWVLKYEEAPAGRVEVSTSHALLHLSP